jgi:hypothetical protein
MVVSVGPYMFRNRRPSAHRAATSGRQRSPPHPRVRTPASVPAGIISSTAGVTTRWVMPRARMVSASTAGAATVSGGTVQTAAPPASAAKISSTEWSNASDAVCATRSPGRTSIRLTASAMIPTPPACGTSTPLGRPVEPEV